jgi:probable HAF family extracellular repeat protein
MKRAMRHLQLLAILLFLPLMAHAQGEDEHAFLWTQAGGMQDLGTIQGWQTSIAYAISDSGEVVGYDVLNTDATTFRWTRSAGMQHLPGSSTTYSVAVAVNDAGDVAGTYDPTSTTGHGFIWTRAGGFQDLGTLGGNNSVVTGMNRSGSIVGYSDTSSGVGHGFLWTQSGGMQDIGTFIPWAVNDTGTIAGESTAANGDAEAAVWVKGRISIISPGQALGINNLGQVVGVRGTPYTSGQAFIWSPGGGGMQILPMLPGAVFSRGQGVNNSGEVVGWSQTTSGFNQAFIWTAAGGTQDIGNLGGLYGAQAFAINDSGEVAGSSTIQ